MPVQIYCGNLNYRMTDDSLREVFEDYGEVVSSKIIKDRETGRSKGFGFVEMSTNEHAEKAISQLNDTEIAGRNIKVNYARPRNF